MCFLLGTYPNWRDRWPRTITSLLVNKGTTVHMTRVLRVYSTTFTNKVEGQNKLIWFRRDCYSFIFHLLISYWLNLSSCSRSSSSLIFSSSQMSSYLEFRCIEWEALLTCCIDLQWCHHAKTSLTKLNLRGPKYIVLKLSAFSKRVLVISMPQWLST